MSRHPDLVVHVTAVPEPGLLRPAIEAAVRGGAWEPGPEAQVAAAVRAAVEGRTAPTTATGGEGS